MCNYFFANAYIRLPLCEVEWILSGASFVFISTGAKLLLNAQKQISNGIFWVISFIFLYSTGAKKYVFKNYGKMKERK